MTREYSKNIETMGWELNDMKINIFKCKLR